jgi:hypothetical protein
MYDEDQKKNEEKLKNSLKIYNSEYHTYNDPYYTSDINIPFNYTSSKNNDFFDNIMDPSCPYNIWTWS